ncbi:aminotransferase [Streptomyces sp. WMMC500]|uniref:amylo-alpha-1,6-glucosidase n=1 Tax=Streptomyces sp. WMMC500 TaxID=3015154 RepID=UPI00248A926B|nr:glycogen debranching N-terminal domain-containing protein [Streptomyces sp. WMMC500]WBB59468.1 aminotransferase [Streptomyces sp. WMMC500]
MSGAEHRLLFHGGAFAAVTRSGDITGDRGAQPDGFFRGDTRHLSRWRLTVDGAVPTLLAAAPAAGSPAAAHAVLVPPTDRDEPPPHTVFRDQRVEGGALVEVLRITGNRAEPEKLWLALTVDADFADQFELRGDHRAYGKPHAVRGREVLPAGVEFRYRRGDWRARTTVTADPAPDAVEETGSGARRLVWRLALEPYETTELTLRAAASSGTGPVWRAAEPAEPAAGPVPAAAATAAGQPRAADPPRPRTAGTPTPAEHAPTAHSTPAHATPTQTAAAHPASPPTAATAATAATGTTGTAARPDLARAAAQGLADLDGLLIPAAGPGGEEVRVPAAGGPWFLALVGRHALVTSLFALHHRPALARATLLALAATQAGDADGEPGKIVHEVRHGELAHFGQVPYGRHYGAVDTTPLFLVLLGALTEHTGDDEPARRLEPQARAAVEWMFRDGGLTDTGYLRCRPDDGGPAGRSWRDSPGALCAADGTRATGAVAPAAPQGYAYAALTHTARLAATAWADPALADRLTAATDDLRTRFPADFWLPGPDFPALALDGTGHPADALASDAGHLLWSGLLDPDRARRVGRRLLEPDFFSGWGVRTVAAGQGAYHPMAYHRGSVWPHDNAILALGLARYGLHEEARTVATALADLASRTAHRLPEAVAGYPRTTQPTPVPFPDTGTPRSWSATTPLALLTALAAAEG